MGKRIARTAAAALAVFGLMSAPLFAAPPEPLPADRLDWQPWGSARPAGALCRGRYVMPGYRLPPPEGERLASESDRVSYGEDGELLLLGDVLLRRGDTQLEAPQVRVPANRETAYADGPLALRDRGLLVRGEAAAVSLIDEAARIDTAHYVAHEPRLRGDATTLARLASGRYRLAEASFTTCEPGSELWRLVAGDILIDRESGVGTARHARLEVGRVPLFYWPWVRFPIDDRRQTGFLWPVLTASGDTLDYAQPFYWSIAPNQDATLMPRWLSEHGLLLGGEYRYLFADDEGRLEGAYLGDDHGGDGEDDLSRRFAGDNRWYLDYRHAGSFSPRTGYLLRYGAASDGRYFDDFGSDFGAQGTSNLLRLAQIGHHGERWQLDARAQGYQKLEVPLADRDKPFYRLPSLTASAQWFQPSGLYQQWHSNATRFWRDVDANRVPLREAANGSRLHLSPALGWRAEAPWGHLEPRLEWLATGYTLDYGERDTDRDETLTRQVPVSTLDAGLVFERDVGLGGGAFRQTLEPRLQYAYVPARDQREFPDFDTSERAFSWQQLWSPHRFSGADRVGDLNRLSWGLESRLLETQSGRERLSLGAGQAIYLDDRHIDMDGDPDTLPTPPEASGDFERYYNATRDRSTLITRLDWRITERWRTRGEWLYDDHLERTERTALDLEYRASAGHAVNLGYRWELQGFDPSLEDDEVRPFDREEIDASFAWKVDTRIDLIGRLLYDHTNDRALEQLAGVQWNDCCYGLQLAWREWVDARDTAAIADDVTDRGLFLRFVFKGLGGVGREADRYFEQAISGYRSTAF